jgi:hypothetical protein
MNTFIYWIGRIQFAFKAIMHRRYALIAVGSALILFGAAVASAWTGPTQAFPNANTAAPVNVGTVDQVKNAGLSVNKFIVFGNTRLGGIAGSNAYLNFGGTSGPSGYGIWDNAGTMEYKNSGGAWTAFGASSLTGPYLPTYATWGSAGAGSGGAAIYNDNSTFNSLMIVGNTSSGLDGGLRQVHLWDDVTVNHNLTVDGTSTAARYCIGSSCITAWTTSQWVNGTGGAIYYSGGNVGVGTVTPLRSLDVYSSGNGFAAVFDGNNGGAAAVAIGGRGGNGQIQAETDDTLTATTNLLLQPNGGYVGINTLTPQAPLEIGNNVGTAGTANQLQLYNSGSSIYGLGISSGSLNIVSAGVTAFYNAGTQTLSINGAGVTASASVTSPQFCIGTSCITSWPSGGSGSLGGTGTANYIPRWTGASTLANSTITDNGTSATATGNFFANQNLYVPNNNIIVQSSLNLNGNQLWTNSGTLYLNYANAGGAVAVGNSSNADQPAKENDLYLNGRLGTDGLSPTSGLPSGWWGGVHTKDIYSEGTIGAGTGGNVNAYMSSSGTINLGNNLTLTGNEAYTTVGSLYLQYHAPANAGVVVGNGTNEQDVTISDGNLNVSANIGAHGKSATAGYPSGWSGGVHTFDLYAEGTIGAGPSGGPPNAWMRSDGTGYFSGTVNAGAFLYNSDERLKKDIEPLTGNLNKVLAMQPVSYNWINPALPQTEQIGFIAQQMQKIEPELVYTNASTTLEAIDYARIAPLLVGAIQELNQKITDQQGQINTQQAEIDELKADISKLESKQ